MKNTEPTKGYWQKKISSLEEENERLKKLLEHCSSCGANAICCGVCGEDVEC